jgi:hypothetical protein
MCTVGDNATCGFTCSIGTCSSQKAQPPPESPGISLRPLTHCLQGRNGDKHGCRRNTLGPARCTKWPSTSAGTSNRTYRATLAKWYATLSMTARFIDCHAACLDPSRCSGSQHREPFREIPVKVHIRRPERDSWVYVGRATVSLDTTGHSSQVGESPHTQLRPAQNRTSEPVRSGPLDRNGQGIGGL